MRLLMRHLLWITIAVAVVAPATLSAQDQDAVARELPQRLTLDDALARATATSHRLAEVRARTTAAEASAAQRRSAQLPVISAQAGYTRTNHVQEFGLPDSTGRLRIFYPDVPDNYRARLDLQWPIYSGGRLQALERAARAEAGAVGQELMAARADLKLEVTRAFWALLTSRESVRVLEEALKRLDAQLHDVRSRFEEGFLPPNDVSSVEAQRARQEVLLIEARNQAVVAEADLARLIDAPDGAAIEIDATLEPPGELPPAVAGLMHEAQQARSERAAIQLRIQAAAEREAAARAGRLPTVGVVSGYDYARPNPKIFPRQDVWQDSWDVGVNVSWSLWDGGRTRAELAEATALATATRERLAEFDQALTLEVKQRSLDLAAAHAQIRAAGEGVRSAAEARRVVDERFAAGVATSTELLDAQVALLEAELDRTRSLANARLALARLDRAVGR
jgi:outer membrane protein TolC